MIPTHNDSHSIKVPITSAAHAAAEAAYQVQAASKRFQTYLNILAVHAVQQYLQWLSIPTDWNTSDSYDPAMRRFLDVADLQVPGYGRLECRPILPGATTLAIPSEVQDDRIGYIAVQLDEDLEMATLLGFTQTASQTSIPLSELQSIELLLDILGDAPAVSIANERVPPELLDWHEPTSLRDWLREQATNLMDTSWQALEAIEHWVTPDTRMELAFSVRSATVAAPIKRGKLVDFAKGGDRVALVVGLQEIDPPETEVSVEVYPTGEEGSYLPTDLELIILDETGVAVMQAQARSNKKIQMEFSGEPGEAFSVRLAMGEVVMTEAFRL